MKIVVVGLGYVGLSNAVLLAQHNEVIGVDISQERVDALNARKSPIIDVELSEYLAEKELDLSASTDLRSSVLGAEYVIVSTPTDYDEATNAFDTSSVEAVIAEILQNQPKTTIVVKSTIPVGFTDEISERLEIDTVIFSPEFLREGRALYDNLYPSRIIVGEKSERAEKFAELLAQGAINKNINILLTGRREAEAIKLFSNTYLAMRVAFFNELDSFAMVREMNSREIIDGVSLDFRIGNHYNNPSFGYGGYCLPKDSKQLLSNYEDIPQDLITAIVESNKTRKNLLRNKIVQTNPSLVGIFRLIMKADSDNFRDSAVLDLIKALNDSDIKVVIYEPKIDEKTYFGAQIENDLTKFKANSDVILVNRYSSELDDAEHKIFTRDIFRNN